MSKPPPKRPRDREATEQAILAAARSVLAEAGFQGLGVNAIARAAGCDKQLVYRYFGGLDGLVDAIGADIAESWTQRLGAAQAQPPARTYSELIVRLALGFLEALRADPLLQRIAAWEVSESSPQVARLNAARSKAMAAWMAAERGDLAPPEGVDAPAVNAVLIAAVQHLVLASATTGHFSGLALKKPQDWERVRAAVAALAEAVYGETLGFQRRPSPDASG